MIEQPCLHSPQLWKEPSGNLRQILLNTLSGKAWTLDGDFSNTTSKYLCLDKFLDFCEPRCPHFKESMDIGNGTYPTDG